LIVDISQHQLRIVSKRLSLQTCLQPTNYELGYAVTYLVNLNINQRKEAGQRLSTEDLAIYSKIPGNAKKYLTLNSLWVKEETLIALDDYTQRGLVSKVIFFVV